LYRLELSEEKKAEIRLKDNGAHTLAFKKRSKEHGDKETALFFDKVEF
jgi:hypothetical protein